MVRYLLIFIFMSSTILLAENISNLLEVYKRESDLSKITKKESAGLITIYTRDELEKMQVHNLMDILKVMPGLFLQKGANGTILLSKPTVDKIPFSAVRLYINDHDMSSSTFNSAFIIWGDMPIEYIDHIEVYKATSSIEFGNETSALVIKLYTKVASREHGGKVRTMVDEKGGYDISGYHAQEISEDFSYFAYGNIDNIKRDEYSNYYQSKEYKLKDDKSSYNLYGNFLVNDWFIEAGAYHKTNDSFIGRGIHQTPTGGELVATQLYTHISKKFDNGFKLQISYDNMDYDRTYEDPNGLVGANLPLMDAYKLHFQDEIYAFILEKTFNLKNHKLMLGGFYKLKKFKEIGDFSAINPSEDSSITFSNNLNLYSLYVEDMYSFNDTTAFIASLKGDFYRYKKDVKNQDKPILKVGITKKLQQYMFKFFYTRTYMSLPFYMVYGPYDVQLLANPDLNPSNLDIFALSAKYQSKHHILELILAQQKIKDLVSYDRTKGFINTGKNTDYEKLQLTYTYQYNLNNRFKLDLFRGYNSLGIKQTPKYGINFRIFNKYKKFDIYNELLFKPAYTYSYITSSGEKQMHMDNSYEYSASIKYHYNKDLSFGLKGDNIFNSGYEQAYRGLSYSIPVTEQKFWINVEYLF